MRKKIIVNADDFGRHPAINRAVSQGFEEGCLTSASIMPGGAAFDEAVSIAQNHLELGIGVHFTLVGERPVLGVKDIPSLVDENGRLFSDYGEFIKRYFLGKIRLDEIRRELNAQMNKVKMAGIKISHIDSHQHLHVLPGIIDIAIDIARENGINAMRIPLVPIGFTGGYSCNMGQFVGRLGLNVFSVLARRKAAKSNFVTPNYFCGIVAGECVNEACLSSIIQQLQLGTTEIMMHPGTDNTVLRRDCAWNHDFEAELNAILSENNINQLKLEEIETINFMEL